MQTSCARKATQFSDVEPSQEACRRALRDSFVAVPEGREIDFRSVLLAADAVRLRTYGQISSRSFLLTRHSALNGRTPIEAIAEPDGRERIRRAVEAVTADFR
jgi:hypothetical protein